MIARKLDSDFTITKRLIERTARKVVNEAVPTKRSNKFVQNYAFGTGGTGSFGNGNSSPHGKTTAVMYDPANPGTTYEKTRNKIIGVHGVYLQDNPGSNAVNIAADVVNDPMWWIGL
jgi:hypothetical protein